MEQAKESKAALRQISESKASMNSYGHSSEYISFIENSASQPNKTWEVNEVERLLNINQARLMLEPRSNNRIPSKELLVLIKKNKLSVSEKTEIMLKEHGMFVDHLILENGVVATLAGIENAFSKHKRPSFDEIIAEVKRAAKRARATTPDV